MSARAARDVLQHAIAGLRDVRTWRSLAYVATSAVTALVWFIVCVAVLVPSLALCVIGVGFVLVIWALRALNLLADFERRRARWIGIEIARPTLGRGSVMARFRDREHWRGAIFGLTAWLPTLCLFIAVVVCWAVPVYLLSIPLWGWAIDSFSVIEIVGQAVAGAGLLLLAPAATRAIATILGRLMSAQLGPDRIALMQQQVTEVTESRSEILTAVAGERRRIERNLHDGVQQQLVALGIDIGLAEAKLDSDPDAARALLAEATKKTRESIGELRTIGRGLHPAILGDRGLDAALSAVVANSAVPVELRTELTIDPPAAIAEAAYFVVSEALTNVMKHSHAHLAVVDAISTTTNLQLVIYDDGRGDADPSGTGLAGIAARVRGLSGTFELVSPTGGPTTIDVVLPYS